MITCNGTQDAWGLLLIGIGIGWVGAQLVLAGLIIWRHKKEQPNGCS